MELVTKQIREILEKEQSSLKAFKGFDIYVKPKSGMKQRQFKHVFNDDSIANQYTGFSKLLNELSSYPLKESNCDIHGILSFDGFSYQTKMGNVDENGLPIWVKHEEEMIISPDLTDVPIPVETYGILNDTFRALEKLKFQGSMGKRRFKLEVKSFYDAYVHLPKFLNIEDDKVKIRIAAKGEWLPDLLENHYRNAVGNEELMEYIGFHYDDSIQGRVVNTEFIEQVQMEEGSLTILVMFLYPLTVTVDDLNDGLNGDIDELREVLDVLREKHQNAKFHIHVCPD